MNRNNFIFDLDGTLVNLRQTWEQAYNELYQRKHGFSLTESELQGMFGPPELECHSTVLKGREIYTPEKAEELVRATERTMVEVLSSINMSEKVLPGARETLQYCREKEYGVACATGNIESIALAILDYSGLRPFFSAIAYSTPELSQRQMIVNKARQELQQQGYECTPQNTYVVGDTPSDIKAARALSLPVIAVATGNYSLEELAAHQPDILLVDLKLFPAMF